MDVLNPPPLPDLNPQQLRTMKLHLLGEISADTAPVTRWHPHRRSVVSALTAAAAISAGAYVTITTLGHGAGVADAAWSPTPTPATSSELAHADTVCRGALRDLTNDPSTVHFVRTAPRVVAERRLRSYSIVLSNGSTVATCLLPDPTRAGPLASTGGFSGPIVIARERAARPTGSGVTLLTGDSLTGDGDGNTRGESRTFIYGRTGPDVRSLVIPLRNGASVTATVAPSGWWEAWYPDNLGSLAQLHRVDVTDTDGTRHIEVLR